jgi:hypothetical protein
MGVQCGRPHQVLGEDGVALVHEVVKDAGHGNDAREPLVVKVFQVLVRVEEGDQDPERVLRRRRW